MCGPAPKPALRGRSRPGSTGLGEPRGQRGQSETDTDTPRSNHSGGLVMTSWGRGVIYAAVVLGFTVGSAAAQNDASAANSGELLPGDMVRITVWQNPELSGEFLVNPEGGVAHPVYQEVKVTGVPLTEAKRRIRDLLAKSY